MNDKPFTSDKPFGIDTDELQQRVRTLVGDLFRLGSDLLTAATSAATAAAAAAGEATAAGKGVTFPKFWPKPRDSCNCGCCGIPETECPPRCCCKMRLAGMTGQTVVARIRVVNDASTPRTFNLSATPFVSGTHKSEFALAPASLTIPAGGSALALGTLVIPATFTKGHYQCEILVHGAYEQCVEVELEICCDEILTGTCTVEQKEQRYRIRAHHWYDHFQCIEPCDHRHDQREPGTQHP